MSAANTLARKRERRLEKASRKQGRGTPMTRQVPCLACGHRVTVRYWQAPFHPRCVRKVVKGLLQP